jgi:hypothetical protein
LAPAAHRAALAGINDSVQDFEMSDLYDELRRAIEEDRIVFSIHADNQLASRGVERWQAVAGVHEGRVVMTNPGARPNPKVVVRQLLPDGSEVFAVWAYVRSIGCAKLVTVFFEESR